ncbi:MAG TPA: nucleoside triphosphate pyrophosphohydrolase [Acidobacteriota bacterium]|jgi:MazG family protein|nr:nucleoside triphosphate pyrophosphohydrolase [Acidobacteriota bacterium]
MEEFTQLVELMDILRGEQGCPWDREQTRETLKPMLVEEAFEVIEAMDDPRALCEELGDLLFQVVFHARIAKENGEFDIRDVMRGVYEKMVRRHPHIFGEQKFSTSGQVLKSWEEIKRGEKKKSGEAEKKSILEGIPKSLPAHYQAFQLTAKAARVGFDWPDTAAIADKMREELDELRHAETEGDSEKIAHEIGDIFFVAVNLARRCGVDPETALSKSNKKFKERFQYMEESLARDGLTLQDASLEEMEARWEKAKKESRQ